jgi:UDP-N-acetylglucosamine--N-acetylmuramyl-(pentapeptide) pyrophosphoryl-undecaprenol N-acetylglucosamine transferase
MSGKENKYRFLFAGGGTGGHLFPAVAVADRIKSLVPEAEILFVGTKSKIEGKVVPELGYKFSSIWIKGFARKFNVENILFPIKLVVSVIQSLIINMKFKPKVAIGSGGYVSGPAIWASSLTGARIILIEQNSYPGVTTKLLEKYADEIHVSFEDTKKYLKNKEKLFLTGTPVRFSLKKIDKTEALKRFKLSSENKTLLVLGGSLGAGSINKAVARVVKDLVKNKIQLIWQTGKGYYQEYKKFSSEFIKVFPFIDKMSYAYSACDLIISRSGSTIAEILALGIPSILVPSPNVAENHQFFNAKSLSDNDAAILIEEKDLNEKLFSEVIAVINDDKRLLALSSRALDLAKPNAAAVIANNAIKYAEAV